jgi:glycosyltransferase involved in cell wall biosynthesis
MLPKAVTINNCVEGARIAVKPSFAASWADRPFLLCVAQHRRNKNIPVALAAFKLLLSKRAIEPDTRFVLIGMKGPETRRIEDAIQSLGLRRRVVLAGGISDSEMNWCYRYCDVLLAPSVVEGFGLPIIEGRMAGCRIVCSDIPAFREVGGKGCRFVELGPNAEKDFAAAVDASLRERRPLPANLSSLSPTSIAPEYLRLYRKLVDSRKTFRSAAASTGAARSEQSKSMETKAAV